MPSKGHCAQQHTLDSNTSGLNGNQQKHITLGAGALTWQAEARNANRALSSSQRIREKSFKLSNASPLLKAIPLSLQHLFAMFGASILIPFLFNQAARTTVVDPALVLIMNGIGTLIYTFVCRGKAPAFLGPSFAFIAPTISCISLAKTPALGFQHALGGFVVAGFVFSTIIIRFAGREWLNVALPPAAMGPIVALIGLELAPVATDMAFHKGRPSAACPPSSAWPRAYSEAVSKALYAGLRAGELSVASNLGLEVDADVASGNSLSSSHGSRRFGARMRPTCGSKRISSISRTTPSLSRIWRSDQVLESGRGGSVRLGAELFTNC